jgi:hypothetical protein
MIGDCIVGWSGMWGFNDANEAINLPKWQGFLLLYNYLCMSGLLFCSNSNWLDCLTWAVGRERIISQSKIQYICGRETCDQSQFEEFSCEVSELYNVMCCLICSSCYLLGVNVFLSVSEYNIKRVKNFKVQSSDIEVFYSFYVVLRNTQKYVAVFCTSRYRTELCHIEYRIEPSIQYVVGRAATQGDLRPVIVCSIFLWGE